MAGGETGGTRRRIVDAVSVDGSLHARNRSETLRHPEVSRNTSSSTPTRTRASRPPRPRDSVVWIRESPPLPTVNSPHSESRGSRSRRPPSSTGHVSDRTKRKARPPRRARQGPGTAVCEQPHPVHQVHNHETEKTLDFRRRSKTPEHYGLREESREPRSILNTSRPRASPLQARRSHPPAQEPDV